jgi:heavy metal translocating P-type ATPase
VPVPVLLAAVVFGIYPLVRTAISDLVRERKIGTEVFVTIATAVALASGEYLAGALLMTIILLAEFIAEFNTDRARASIRALMGSVPQTATLRDGDRERTIPVSELKPGDIVLARAGEKIPVDGAVTGGSGAVDEATITGESIPVEKSSGAAVLAGTVVTTGAIDVRAEKIGRDTTFARIIALVEEAESAEAPVQKLADRVAAWLLPVVLILLVIAYFVTRDPRKIVALLIFTSPAELGLATPMVMIAAIARAARHGILVKGGLYLEVLAKVDTIVFDKTGTLTYGQPEVTGVTVYDTRFNEHDVLQFAAAADRRSAHPLAKAVLTYAERRGIDIPDATQFETIHGRGVSALIGARQVLVGNKALLGEKHVTNDAATNRPVGGSEVLVAIDGRLAGAIHFADEIRPGTDKVIARLKATGIRRVLMLTGDNEETARRVGDQLGITDVRAHLLPDQKIAAIESLRREGHVVAMVGDGVNDAPALARASVGIAMGARGTQAAIEAADIALMTDDLGRIVLARTLARRAYRTIQENLWGGVGVVHVLGITAALLGWIGPVQAALLHLGPDVLVFLNSVKLLHVRIDESM